MIVSITSLPPTPISSKVIVADDDHDHEDTMTNEWIDWTETRFRGPLRGTAAASHASNNFLNNNNYTVPANATTTTTTTASSAKPSALVGMGGRVHSVMKSQQRLKGIRSRCGVVTSFKMELMWFILF